MGIDRMLMVLTGLGIRETILFPFVKPAARTKADAGRDAGAES